MWWTQLLAILCIVMLLAPRAKAMPTEAFCEECTPPCNAVGQICKGGVDVVDSASSSPVHRYASGTES
jgi:hypothetical protein